MGCVGEDLAASSDEDLPIYFLDSWWSRIVPHRPQVAVSRRRRQLSFLENSSHGPLQVALVKRVAGVEETLRLGSS